MTGIDILASNSNKTKFDFQLIPSLQFEKKNFKTPFTLGMISSMAQDQKGFLWISSSEGVFRYDGFDLKPYLKDDSYFRIFVSSNHDIWAMGANSIKRYNPHLDQFVKVELKYLANSSESSLEHAYSIVETEDRRLWLISNGGLLHEIQNNSIIEHYELPTDIRFKENLNTVVHSGPNYFLAALGNEVFEFSSEKNQFVKILTLPKSSALITTISHINNNQSVLFGTNEGIYQWNKAEQTLNFYSGEQLNKANQPIVTSFILNDSQGKIWVTHDSGVALFDVNQGQFVNVPQLDKYEVFSHLFEDRNGILWFSSISGVISHSIDSIAFYLTTPEDDSSLVSSALFSVLIDSTNRIWIGSHSAGLNMKPLGADKYKTYVEDGKPGSISNNGVFTLYEDSLNRIWLGTLNGLNLYTENTEQFQTFWPDETTRNSPSNSILSIEEDPTISNRFWIGTIEGLLRLDFSEDENGILKEAARKVFLKNQIIFDIHISQDNQVWVGTINGLYRLDLSGSLLTHYKASDKNNTITEDWINTIYQDESGTIWIGCANGLVRYREETNDFVVVNFSPERKGSGITRIFESQRGDLWLVSNALYRLDRKTNQSVERYDYIDGYNFDPTSLAISPKGEVYLSTLANGLVYFTPVSSTTQSNVGLTQIIFNSEIITRSIESFPLSENGTPQLPYNNRRIEFEFTNFHFLRSESQEFQYRLTGFDDQWQSTPNTVRNAVFTNLPPGEYSFDFRSRLPLGQWGEESFQFTIAKPFWMTNWAYAVYALLLLLLMWGAAKVQTRLLKRRNMALEAKVSARTLEISKKNVEISELLKAKETFYTNVSHEFRTPLTVMMLPIQRMMRQETKNGEWPAAYRQGLRLVRMVDHLIDHSRQDGNKLHNIKPTPIRDHVYNLFEAYLAIAREKNQTMKLEMDISQQTIYLSEDFIEQVLGNLIINAIKYTPEKGNIQIKVIESQDWLNMSVEDDGPGIARTKRNSIFERFHRLENTKDRDITGLGIGLSIVKDITADNGGEVFVEDGEKTGSRFIVRIPIKPMLDNAHEPNKQEFFQADSNATHQITYQVAPKSSERIKVLIVEDNEDLRTMLVDELSWWFDCLQASNGEEGITIAEKEIPDIIVSDIMMPQVDGYELCQRLKESNATSHIPVLLLTAKSDQKSRIKGWQFEADAYLNKPFNLDELKQRIDNLHRSRQRLAKQFKQRFISDAASTPSQISNDSTNQDQTELFLAEIKRIVEKNYSNAAFSTESMAEEMYLSSRQLQRKIQATIGMSPKEYLKQYRLKQAKLFLKQNMQAATVAHTVGFSSPAYFGACFKSEFNQTPVQFQQSATG